MQMRGEVCPHRRNQRSGPRYGLSWNPWYECVKSLSWAGCGSGQESHWSDPTPDPFPLAVCIFTITGFWFLPGTGAWEGAKAPLLEKNTSNEHKECYLHRRSPGGQINLISPEVYKPDGSEHCLPGYKLPWPTVAALGEHYLSKSH